MVFPPTEVQQNRAQMTGKAAYTLPSGQHEYPFSFKVPFNNACSVHQKSAVPVMIGMEVAMPATQHVKRTLPPTMAGFPGEAEIRYFVKATVSRHSFFKENPRAYAPFNFFPIEPPRQQSTGPGSEIYARQRHVFSPFPDDVPSKEKMRSLFGMKSSAPNSPISPTFSKEAPNLSVDARLPEPAILTCNKDIPLRLLVKKLNNSNDAISLQSLQISLIGLTKIRAHQVYRTETNSWIITSQSNMNIPIGTTSDGEGAENVLDDRPWRGVALPNNVAPSFVTCNIERSYQLDVRIGLSYASSSGHKVRPGQLRRIVRETR